MEDATKVHNEFTKELTDLITKFHENHPDLFINDIDIKVGESLMGGGRTFLGIRVEILVQPYRGEENQS